MKQLFFSLSICLLWTITASAQSWAGDWQTNFGKLRLHHKSNKVYGDYDDKGIIDGLQVYHNQVNGTFTNGKKEGWFKFTRSGKKFTGSWGWKDKPKSGDWTGTQTSTQKPLLKSTTIQGKWESPFGDISIRQEGLTVNGSFQKGGTMSGRLDVTTGKVNGSMYRQGKNAQFWLMPKARTEGLWIGKCTNPNTGKLTYAFYIKSPKQLSEAEFKSMTGASNTQLQQSSTTTSMRSSALSTSSPSGTVTYRTTKKETREERIKRISGVYRVTVTRILTSYNEGGDLFDDIDLYGSMMVRVFGQVPSGNVQLRAMYGKPPRIWEASGDNPISIDESRIDDTESVTISYESMQIQETIKWYGEYEIDKIREFRVEEEMANDKLQFVLTAQLNRSKIGPDKKYRSINGKISVDDMTLGKEYFIKIYGTNNDYCYVGFEITKNQ